MKRIEDFRVGELRIPADRFPLLPRVEELLQAYSGFGQWEGAPYGCRAWLSLSCRCIALRR
jgi:hypothetical protein